MQGFGILRTKWGVREIFKEYQHTGCPYTHIYKIHSVSGCWSRDNMVFRQLLVVSLYTGKKSCFVGSEYLATWYKLTQTGGLVSFISRWVSPIYCENINSKNVIPVFISHGCDLKEENMATLEQRFFVPKNQNAVPYRRYLSIVYVYVSRSVTNVNR